MYDELVKRLREDAEWAEANEWETPITLSDNLKQAADAIEELQGRAKVLEKLADKWCEAVPKWIPTTERLPVGGDDSGAVCENVCLMMDDGTVSCGWMNGITKKAYYLNARDDVVIKAPITRVTNWMPLPPAPKEAE